MNHFNSLKDTVERKQPFAHSKKGAPVSEWQPLKIHLENVAGKAANFASEFGAFSWGYIAGLWHDLGKYCPEFQNRILASEDASIEAPGRVNHSTAGALLSMERFGKLGRILAYPITGHHAGLPDWQNAFSPLSSLSVRLSESLHLMAAKSGDIPATILEHMGPDPKEKAKSGTELSRSLWLRMLFSCLVDADFIDTEAFLEPGKTKKRTGYPLLSALSPLLDSYMEKKTDQAPDTEVNRCRLEVLSTCREKATDHPGIFTLSVPTGGGKTLSSMAFAMKHALQYGKQRIIYVIPYTSIIEQTADQFREIFDEAVLEHHSNMDSADASMENTRSRLACENWDAPIIVTTTVQFFESLFASRASRCRKLHNIVNSVVVLDEAQLLPADYLSPVLAVLDDLSRNYGVTLILSTATQPALGPHKSMEYNFKGLSNLKEIISDPLAIHKRLKRTKVVSINRLASPLSWDQLSKCLSSHQSVLCIVNRRDDARILWEKMPRGAFHLSALMCGAHRSKRIAEIRNSLKESQPTRVVSTQLVEAGVDLDFPVVYRALAGLDSVAQAAGRCNREGTLSEGIVHVFLPESKIPQGHLRQAAEIGWQLLSDNDGDMLAPERFERFFQSLYWMRGNRLDKEGILDLLKDDANLEISFRTAAEKFKIIDETAYAPVIVQYCDGASLIELLRRHGPERWVLRRLQRFTVNLPRNVHGKLLANGAIVEIHPGIFVQDHGGLYHDQLGFCADRSNIYEPDELIC